MFVAGFGVGLIVSAIGWTIGWKAHAFDYAALFIPVVKLVVGLIAILVPGWRGFGAGVLISLALGLLIFAGLCMAFLGHV